MIVSLLKSLFVSSACPSFVLVSQEETQRQRQMSQPQQQMSSPPNQQPQQRRAPTANDVYGDPHDQRRFPPPLPQQQQMPPPQQQRLPLQQQPAGPPPKMCGVGVVLVQVSGGAVCVKSVNKGGPAYNSGQIVRGDVLYAIDGQKVPATSISCLLRWKHPGTSLTTGCHTGARLGRRAGEALQSGACGLADYYELPACRQPGCWQAFYRRDHDPSAR